MLRLMKICSRAALYSACFGLLVATASAATISVNQSMINFETAASGVAAAVNGNFQYGTAPNTTSLISSATSLPAFAQYLSTEHTDSFGGNSDLQGFYQTNANNNPLLIVNTGSSTTTTYFGAPLAPGEIGFHPDSGGSREYSVILWTAPSNGTFSDSAKYADIGGNTTTLVYLQDPTGTQTSTTGASPTLTSSGSIAAGQTIAFLVGSENGYGFNATGLTASITFNPTPVPEPSSFALAAVGLLGCMGVKRLRGTHTAATISDLVAS